MTDEAQEAQQKAGRGPVIGVALAILVAGAGGGLYFATRSQPNASAAEAAADAGAATEPSFDTKVARGEWLFQNKGCFACHGQRGHGGVANENYVLDTVPRLDQMADRLMLFEPEDATAAIQLIEDGTELASVASDPPFPGYARFQAQHGVVKELILNGAHAAKKDPNGVEPPLQMPSWRGVLSDDDVESVIAYLISIYDWDDDGDVTASND